MFLTPGAGYIIGGENFARSTDFLSFNVSGQVVDPRISFVDATFTGFGSGLNRPTNFSGATTGFYGPGFTIQAVQVTPEPASMVLVATGLIGIGGIVCRRRKA